MKSGKSELSIKKVYVLVSIFSMFLFSFLGDFVIAYWVGLVQGAITTYLIRDLEEDA